MDVLGDYYTAMDFKGSYEWAKNESLRRLGARPRSFLLTLANIAGYDRLAIALEGANCPLEPNLRTSHREVFYIAMTLIQARREVNVKVIILGVRHQMLIEGTTLSHCELVTLTIRNLKL
jgi:hypothetical protein